jgi:hypothetical protein
MKKENNNVRINRTQGVAFQREAIAYAIGHIESWVEQFSKTSGIPYATLADGVFTSLGDARDRSDVQMQQMRNDSPEQSEVLFSKMALGSRARKSVQSTAQRKERLAKRIWRRMTPGRRKKILAALQAGISKPTIVKKYHVAYETINKLQKEAA